MKTLLLSITTTHGDSWKSQINEVRELGLAQIAVFPTCMDQNQRSEFYRELETLRDIQIPFVHARNDMKEREYRYLIDTFGTEYFNLHPRRHFTIDYIEHVKPFLNIICIENTHDLLLEDIPPFGGICIDHSHLEDSRIVDHNQYKAILHVANTFPVLANHIGPTLSTPVMQQFKTPRLSYASHYIHDLSNFDYLANVSEQFFGKYLALEVENAIKLQLEAKAYIQKLVKFSLN